FHVLGMEDDRAVRISDLARGQTERDVRVGRLSFFGVAPLNPHFLCPLNSGVVIPAAYTAQYKSPMFSPRRGRANPAGVVPHSFLCLPPQPTRLYAPVLF